MERLHALVNWVFDAICIYLLFFCKNQNLLGSQAWTVYCTMRQRDSDKSVLLTILSKIGGKYCSDDAEGNILEQEAESIRSSAGHRG